MFGKIIRLIQQRQTTQAAMGRGGGGLPLGLLVRVMPRLTNASHPMATVVGGSAAAAVTALRQERKRH